MTQKQKLEDATGIKMPEPTEQEQQRIQLENSPFWIIGNDQKGYNIIMGKWKLNKKPIPSKIDTWEWLENNKWNIILSMIIAATTDLTNNQNKQ